MDDIQNNIQNNIMIHNKILHTMIGIRGQITDSNDDLVQIIRYITLINNQYNEAYYTRTLDFMRTYYIFLNSALNALRKGTLSFLHIYCNTYMRSKDIVKILEKQKNVVFIQLPKFMQAVFLILKFYNGRHTMPYAQNAIENISKFIEFVIKIDATKSNNNKAIYDMIENINVLRDVNETSIEQYFNSINETIQKIIIQKRDIAQFVSKANANIAAIKHKKTVLENVVKP